MTETLADLSAAFTLFREAVLTGVVAGAVLGYLGVHVVLRRMVFVTAGLTQAAALGVALAFYAHIHLDLHVPPLMGAIVVALLAAGVLSLDSRRLNMSREAVLAAVWLVGSAGAVLIGDRITQEAHDIAGILFGSAVLVRASDLAAVVGIGGLVFAVTALLRRPLIYAAFDPDGARVAGVSVRLLELWVLCAVAVVVSVTTRALGALPVFAFTVLPAMAALMASGRLRTSMRLAPVLGGLAGGGGFLAAFVLDFPVGASQAMVAALFAAIASAVAAARRRG